MLCICNLEPRPSASRGMVDVLREETLENAISRGKESSHDIWPSTSEMYNRIGGG